MRLPAVGAREGQRSPDALRSRGGTAQLVLDLITLTKPRLSLLVLCTLAGGMWLAPGTLSASQWLGTALGTALLVGAANALNCWAERDRDRLMSRTRNRPLPSGRLSPDAALAFGVLLAAAAFPILARGSNLLTLALGLLALTSYVLAYTPMKSRSAWALIVGALPGALPPLMGWTSVTGKLDPGGLLLFALLVAWQIPHFLAIALFRRQEYAAAGHRVFPLVFGDRATRACMAVWALLLLGVSLGLSSRGLGGPLYIGVALTFGLAYFLLVLWGACLEGGRAWAARVFQLSVLHLTALFVALLLSAHAHSRISPLPEAEPLVVHRSR